MKVVTAKMMSELEKFAYGQGCGEKEFMEQAGKGIAHIVQNYLKDISTKHCILLCGKGNNAGDAFVAGRHLLRQGFHVVAIQLDKLEDCSPLCQENGRLFLKQKGTITNHYAPFPPEGVIIDGIFGTGFKGAVKEPYSSLIHAANSSKLPILSIDIPSGLDGTTGQIEGDAIHANKTIFLGLPKTGFFLEQGWNVVGKLQGVDFGLPRGIVENAQSEFEMVTAEKVAKFLPPILRNRHKYQAGYVIGLAGSPTMPGAALLSSLASLRAGSGMVRLLHPVGMEAQLSSSPYELIKIPYTYENVHEVLTLMQKADATFIGPGLGTHQKVQQLLNDVCPRLEKPCVIDADALTLFSEGAFSLPPKAILTPHSGEMQRLLKSDSKLQLDLNTLHTCQKYAEKHQITLILKGAPTFIFHPHSPIAVNTTGDPGMATAGSGDVLTGLLASLLSQKLDTRQAALLGVYLHGLSGELAAKNRGTSYGIIATDLINNFAAAYRTLIKGLV